MSRNFPRKAFFRLLGETFHVPKNMRVVVMKEMEKKGLIKCVKGRKNNIIEVCKCNLDVEKDASKFYKWVGLYE